MHVFSVTSAIMIMGHFVMSFTRLVCATKKDGLYDNVPCVCLLDFSIEAESLFKPYQLDESNYNLCLHLN